MSILSEFSQDEIDGVIAENANLRGYLQGYLAEVALKKQLLLLEDVTEVTKIPDRATERGDLKVIYKNIPITIEVKSVQSRNIRPDVLNDTWQGTVSVKSSDKREIDVPGLGIIRTSNLTRGSFDILAVSCYAVSNAWDFVFIDNDYMPFKGPETPNLLKTNFMINPETTPCLNTDMKSILELVYNKKQSNC